MSTQPDPRVAELTALAVSENIRLPYPAHYIAWLEDRGRVVNLMTGHVFDASSVAPMPTPSAQAVCHLLGHVEGEIAI